MPVYIVTGGEEEDADYFFNDNDSLSEFDYDNPYRAEEIYNEFSPGCDKLNESMLSVSSHRWNNGQLQFKIIWNTNEHTWETFPDMKEDHPWATANYIVCNNATRNKSRDPYLKWAKHTIHDIRRTIRRTLKLYEFIMDESDRLFRVRRKICGSKKKKRIDFTRKKFKYGLEEPQHIKRTLEIDAEREDTKWYDSMALEVDSLKDIYCF